MACKLVADQTLPALRVERGRRWRGVVAMRGVMEATRKVVVGRSRCCQARWKDGIPAHEKMSTGAQSSDWRGNQPTTQNLQNF